MSATQHNIAIVGGGIMGLSNAFTLLRAGHCITIFDPAGFPAHNASLMAGGMLAPYSEIEHMPSEWVEAGLEGIALWRDIVAALPADTIDFHQKGSLFIAHRDDQYILERFAAHLTQEKACRRVGQDDIAELEPQLAARFSSGLYLEQEAHIYPLQAMQALCDYLSAQGTTLKTEWADPYKLQEQFDWVIDCRGYGAQEQPLRGVKGELVIVRNEDFALSRPVRLMHPRYPLYIVPRPDHTFMIGATVIESAEEESVSLRSAMELMSALYALHSSFGDSQIVDLQAGIRPSYDDNLPRIKVEGNMLSCNGLFRHGFLLSPFMAACVKDHIEDTQNNFKSSFIIERNNENYNQRDRQRLHSAA